MPGSIQIATIRGIPIRVHVTLFLLFALFVSELGPLGVPAALLLFASTLLHELGHSLLAQRAGLPISSIELHLMGGTALMQSPKKPRHELVIALAGPLVSLTLGALALLATALLGWSLTLTPRWIGDLLPFFAVVNLGMAVFNLLPALPMDGGRVLRALLARRMELVAATRIATFVSRVFALAMLAFGLFTGAWTFALFGVVIYWLAGRELRAAELQAWRSAHEEQLRAMQEVFAQAAGLRGLWPPPSRRPARPGEPSHGPGTIIDV